MIAALLSLVLSAGGFPAKALDPDISIRDLHHRSYTLEDGLPNGVSAMGQTSDGYIWLGSAQGLYRFDGVRFQPMAAGKLLWPGISALRGSDTGDLWIGYDNGGLSRLRRGEIVHFTSSNGGPAGAGVNTIRVATDGEEVWAVVSLRAWRRSGGAWRQPLGNTQVWAMEQAGDGVTWLKNGDALFHCRPKGGPCAQTAGYAGGVMGFMRDRGGRVWTSDTDAPGRMYRLPEAAALRGDRPPRREFGATLSPRLRGRMLLDRHGALWNVNVQHGLLRAPSILAGREDAGRLDSFTAADGLTDDRAERMFEDREGSIWVSTRAGLDQFRPANLRLERAIPTKVNDYAYFADTLGGALYVHANTGDDNSSIFAGARGPLFRIPAQGAVERVAPDMRGVSSIAGSRDGTLWAGGIWGLFRLNGPMPVAIETPGSASGSTVVAVIERPGDRLWVWLYGEGVWERSAAGWRQVPTMPSAEDLKHVEFVRKGRDGAIWMARTDPFVLFRHQDDRIQRFTEAQVGIGPPRAVFVAGAAEYLGGARGIARFEDGRFLTLGSDRLPALSGVTGVAEAGADLWVVTGSAILRFKRDDAVRAMRDPKAPPPAYERFDQRDGLPAPADLASAASTANTVFPRPDGRILFVTGAGLVWMDPGALFRNPLPPPVDIQSLTSGDRVFAPTAGLKLPAGTSSLQIDFTALSFVEPSRVQLRYRLEGVDKGWIDPGLRRQAMYTRLGPGRYQFRVIAANDAGVWNRDGASIAFEIQPTFLESWPFRALLALALLALLALAYRLRVAAVTDRLRQRMAERMEERERIARELHDTLLQSVQALTLRFQLALDDLPKRARARPALEAAIDQADQAISEGRDRVRDLRTSDGPGDIEQVIRDTLRRQGFPPAVTVQVHTTGGAGPLDPLVAGEIGRIAGEAIFNIWRHAEARHVTVEIGYGPDFTLSVMDDGIGIDPQVAKDGGRKGHFGLSGMTERARKLGGRLAVRRRPEGGSEVLLTVPGRVAFRLARVRFRWPWSGMR